MRFVDILYEYVCESNKMIAQKNVFCYNFRYFYITHISAWKKACILHNIIKFVNQKTKEKQLFFTNSLLLLDAL